ncbi:hypothetical protein D3C87_1150840 [compost metagenome]
MPSCSMRRLTKAKSVSWYCTQYSHWRYEALSFFSKAKPYSPSTSSRISTTDLFWKILQSLVRVRYHSHGRTEARYTV